MKNAKLIGMFFLGAALAAGITGCKHKGMVTPIPDNMQRPQQPPTGRSNPDQDRGVPIPVTPPVTQEPIVLDYGAYAKLFNGDYNADREKFKADTIYFELDSSTIKASEQSKLQDLAAYFKDNKKFEGLIIEGNCDERGTEKYNLSLGERRALAAREYLANLGVDPQRIKTVTFGKSKPADPGHDEAAWKQNRRDEFVLATPK